MMRGKSPPSESITDVTLKKIVKLKELFLVNGGFEKDVAYYRVLCFCPKNSYTLK